MLGIGLDWSSQIIIDDEAFLDIWIKDLVWTCCALSHLHHGRILNNNITSTTSPALLKLVSPCLCLFYPELHHHYKRSSEADHDAPQLTKHHSSGQFSCYKHPRLGYQVSAG